ncbi:MAG: hypothetical protein LQ350_008035 [Teloschistes chrysophthalmus]|nr:MAG: hypothetical protein LQ350_008035 [Niorma chrysophthalma]
MSESILEMEEGLHRGYEERMEDSLKMAASTFTSCFAVSALAIAWHRYVESEVPMPYLDEFFHVQQAELYLEGHFSQWHPKITTPPGLYGVSLFLLGILSLIGVIKYIRVADLRRTNLLAATLLPVSLRSIVSKNISKYDGFDSNPEMLSDLWLKAEVNHAVFNMCIFPPLCFFYALYYTDVWSVLSVLITFQFHQWKWRRFMVVAAIFSLFFRQTNIFWVAIFLGGLEIIRKIQPGRSGVEFPAKPTLLDIVTGSWQHSRIYDPLINQASFGDYIMTALSLAVATLAQLPQLLRILKPYLIVLSAFAWFVLWNEGVVMGDKENHIASIHLAQMLYIWPYIMFFSFALLYPYILAAIIPRKLLPSSLRATPPSIQRPQLKVALPICAIMALIVRYNTIVHPFTLADNRHYTFYVFRLLLRSHPLTRYAVIPIYYFSAYAAIAALGGYPNVPKPRRKSSTSRPERNQIRSGLQPRLPPPGVESVANDYRGNHVSLALIWLLSTALSVITAPLVEPRYFILPWLIWRIYVVPSRSTGENTARRLDKKDRGIREFVKGVFWNRHDPNVWLETVWLAAVNWGVGYVFLYGGFEWVGERGRVQRFMW